MSSGSLYDHGVLSGSSGRATVKAGGIVSATGRVPRVETFVWFGQLYPYDIRPAPMGTKRPIDLETAAQYASTCTLAISWPLGPRDGIGSAPNVYPPTPVPKATGKTHVLRVEFGNGQTNHVLETDVTMGTALQIPSQVIQCEFLDETLVFDPDDYPNPPNRLPDLEVQSQTSIAYYSNSHTGRRTQRALSVLGLYPNGGPSGSGLGSSASGSTPSSPPVSPFVRADGQPMPGTPNLALARALSAQRVDDWTRARGWACAYEALRQALPSTSPPPTTPGGRP